MAITNKIKEAYLSRKHIFGFSILWFFISVAENELERFIFGTERAIKVGLTTVETCVRSDRNLVYGMWYVGLAVSDRRITFYNADFVSRQSMDVGRSDDLPS